jgi:hypothetical protein
MTQKQNAREIQAAIAQILKEDWDPIAVRDEPEAAGEYDAYVGGVYRLLASGANAQQVAEHLVAIERDRIGFEETRVEALLPVAKKLCRLDVRLHGSRPTS